MLGPIMWHTIGTLNEFSTVPAQQATSKCSSILAESSWLRHQTWYHCNFTTDEKDRIFLTAYLEKVSQNRAFDTALSTKWGQPLWYVTQSENRLVYQSHVTVLQVTPNKKKSMKALSLLSYWLIISLEIMVHTVHWVLYCILWMLLNC